MASEAAPAAAEACLAVRRAASLAIAIAACCVASACFRGSPDPVAIAWSLTDANTTAATRVRVTLRDSRGPLSGATLTLEGHMSHPGMAPLVAAVTETTAGVYEGHLRFTMTGDWTLVVTGSLPDGTRLTEQQRFEIRGAPPAA